MRADCFLSRVSFLTLTILIVTAFGASPASGVVVGRGTPEFCTRGDLNAALVTGGNITFNCGPEPLTIVLKPTRRILIDTTIDGGGKITLKASNDSHFQVPAGKTLSLLNLSLTEGSGTTGAGGAITNLGTLRIVSVTFANNTSADKGGAIFNKGTLTVRNSTFSQNKAATGGGAIWNEGGTVDVNGGQFDNNQATNDNAFGGAIGSSSGMLTVTNGRFIDNSAANGGALSSFSNATVELSVFSGNEATSTGGLSGGGAISCSGTMTVKRSTLIGNQARSQGGAINFFGTLTMTASTLNGNTAVRVGGGIAADGDASYTNCTLSGNESGGDGSAIFQHHGSAVMLFTTIANNHPTSDGHTGGVHVALGTASFQNTILSNNASLNCGGDPGELISRGNNLSSDTSCAFAFTQPSDKNGVDAKLGLLANNGGPTLTHLPQAGSPAIDAAAMVSGVTTDQRGVARPRGPNPDIGSVEAQ